MGLTVIIGFLPNSGKLLMAVKFDNQPKDCTYSRIQSYDLDLLADLFFLIGWLTHHNGWLAHLNG